MPKRSSKTKKQNPRNKTQKAIEEPHFSSKKFSKIFRVVAGTTGGAIAIISVFIAYIEIVHPRLSVSIDPTPTKIFDTNYIVTNEGHLFTLYDVKATVRMDAEFPSYIVKNFKVEMPMSKLGNIPPRGNSTFPSSRVQRIENWEKIWICILVDFTIDPPFGVKKFKRTEKFGFLVDKSLSLNHWITRPCNE